MNKIIFLQDLYFQQHIHAKECWLSQTSQKGDPNIHEQLGIGEVSFLAIIPRTQIFITFFYYDEFSNLKLA